MDKEKLYFNSSPNPIIGVESELYINELEQGT